MYGIESMRVTLGYVRMVASWKPFVPKDNYPSQLTGVQFTVEDGVVRAVVTDKYRIAMHNDPVGSHSPVYSVVVDKESVGLVVPMDLFVQFATATRSEKNLSLVVDIVVEDGAVTISNGYASVQGRVLGGLYPSVTRLVNEWSADGSSGRSMILDTAKYADYGKIVGYSTGKKLPSAFTMEFHGADDNGQVTGAVRLTTPHDERFVGLIQPNRVNK